MRLLLAVGLFLVFLSLLVWWAAPGDVDDDTLDADGDGLDDHEETNGWIITVDLMGRRVQYEVDSDPELADTDGDGIRDVFEFGIGTDPRKADTDEDGLSDCEEAQHSVRAECEDPDFSGETDGGLGTSPVRADSDPGFNRYWVRHEPFVDEVGTAPDPITWGDGISDGQEVAGYWIDLPDGDRRFVQTDPMRIDSDGDGLEDGEEVLLFGSDPTVVDTDLDGCRDGLDVQPGFREGFLPGLSSLRWNHTGDPAQARFVLTVADARIASDNATLHPGDNALDLREVADRPERCAFSPYEPWLPVEVIVFVDGHPLDLTSHSHPNGGHRGYWNPLLGVWNTQPRAEGAQATPIVWSGTGGEVVFSPRIVAL